MREENRVAYPPKFGGYFVTVDDEKQAQALAFFEYTELRKRHATLRSEADRFADQYANVADMLRTRPEMMTPDIQTITRDAERIVRLVADIKATSEELTRRVERLQQMGLSEFVGN